MLTHTDTGEVLCGPSTQYLALGGEVILANFIILLVILINFIYLLQALPELMIGGGGGVRSILVNFILFVSDLVQFYLFVAGWGGVRFILTNFIIFWSSWSTVSFCYRHCPGSRFRGGGLFWPNLSFFCSSWPTLTFRYRLKSLIIMTYIFIKWQN